MGKKKVPLGSRFSVSAADDIGNVIFTQRPDGRYIVSSDRRYLDDAPLLSVREIRKQGLLNPDRATAFARAYA